MHTIRREVTEEISELNGKLGWFFSFAKRDRKVCMRINRDIKIFAHKVWEQAEGKGIKIHNNPMIVLIRKAGTKEGMDAYPDIPALGDIFRETGGIRMWEDFEVIFMSYISHQLKLS